MDLAAWTARTSVAHLPEIVLAAVLLAKKANPLLVFRQLGSRVFEERIYRQDIIENRLASVQTYLEISGHDVILGNASSEPQLFGFGIGLKSSSWIAFEVGDVEASRIQAIDLCEQLPRVLANHGWSAKKGAK
jgi:hypothetical protein